MEALSKTPNSGIVNGKYDSIGETTEHFCIFKHTEELNENLHLPPKIPFALVQELNYRQMTYTDLYLGLQSPKVLLPLHMVQLQLFNEYTVIGLFREELFEEKEDSL